MTTWPWCSRSWGSGGAHWNRRAAGIAGWWRRKRSAAFCRAVAQSHGSGGVRRGCRQASRYLRERARGLDGFLNDGPCRHTQFADAGGDIRALLATSVPAGDLRPRRPTSVPGGDLRP